MKKLFYLLWYFFNFYFIFISWRLITLQYCSGFCHTLTWISHGFTCIPHPDPPSHLSLHPIPLGLPSAPGPSTCLMHIMILLFLKVKVVLTSQKKSKCIRNTLIISIFSLQSCPKIQPTWSNWRMISKPFFLFIQIYTEFISFLLLIPRRIL